MSAEEKVIYSGIVALVALWFWLWSVVDATLGGPDRFRLARKSLWVTVCLVVPVLGGAAYLVIGRNFGTPRLRAPGGPE